MAGILIGAAFVRIDADTKPALKALQGLGAIGASALTTAIGPAVAAVGAGVGAMTATLASAGAAGGAFAAAVIPQFQKITESGEKLEAAEEAQEKATLAKTHAQKLAKEVGATYGKQLEITEGMSDEARARAEEYNRALSGVTTATEAARKSQAIYDEKMAAMTPATRGTAKAFERLKDDVDRWSDSLSSTTMPLFTAGIEKIRDILPRLSPFVRIATREIKEFTSSFGEGQAGRVFREFGANLQGNAGSALGNLLSSIKNITVGIVGMINAFMPAQSEMSGGLVELTERFANFGANLGQSEGFATFMERARGAIPPLKEFGSALADIGSAAGPMGGFGLLMLQIFADIVAAIPTPVLRLLVPAILAVNAALKLYRIYQAAATAATWLFRTSVTAASGAVYASRAVMIFHRIQLVATTLATRAAAAATWLWSTALRVGRAAMLAFRYALVAVRLAVALTTAGLRILAVALISSPIGLAITALIALGAAIFLLWKKSETFRSVVRKVWAGIQEAVSLVVDWFMGNVVPFFTRTLPGVFRKVLDWVRTNWPWILGALTGPIGLAVVWIIKNWDKVRAGLAAAWSAIVRTVLAPIGRFFTQTIPDAAVALRTRVEMAWRSLVASLTGAYNWVRARVFSPVINYFTVRIPNGAANLRDNVIRAWRTLRDGVLGAFTWLRARVLNPVINYFTVRIPNGVGNLRDNVIRAWRSLRDGVVAAYGWVRSRVFSPVINYFTVRIPNGARNLRDNVIRAWNGLRDRLTGVYSSIRARVFSPIGRFFTATIPGWARTMRDRVSGFFREMRDGVGTIWRGIQNRTKAPINWVLRNVWNNGIVKVWGRIAGWVGMDNKLKAVKLLAAGGTVGKAQPGVFNRPTAIVGEGNPRYPEYVIPTDPRYATRARGLWEAAGAHFYEDGGILGTIKGAIGSTFNTAAKISKGMTDFLANPVAKAKEMLLGPLKNITRAIGSSQWARMAARLPRMAVDGLVQAVKSVGSDLLGLGGTGNWDVRGSGVQRWTGVVRQALGLTGQPAAYTGITLRRMNQESGGNPRAVNKWDSNWQAGYPSVGLMQVIGPTFRSYAGRFRNVGPFLYGTSINPLANVYASMRYALAAYGSLPRAYNRPGGYALGTDGATSGWHWTGELGPELMKFPAGTRIRSHRASVRQAAGASAAVVHLTVENHGVIGSRIEVENWLADSLDQLRRKNRLPRALGGTA